MSIARIRQSQIVSTYGPGALVDLPDNAVLVAGLEYWQGDAPLVAEPRLLANLRRRLGIPYLELRSPPVPKREEDQGTGVVAWQFPEWFLAQYEVVSREYGRSRPLVHRRNLVKGRYAGEDQAGKRKRKDWPVVPIRFVQACPDGHVSDIDWKALVHGLGAAPCAGQLWFDERGTTGDLTELFVRCDGPCGLRPLPLVQLQSISEERSLLGQCPGVRLWLGPAVQPETCSRRSKLLTRHASNAYFPIIERALAIPDQGERVRRAVDAVWDDFLSVAESADDVRRERKKPRVHQALEGLTDAEVWSECERRQKGGGADAQKGLREVEHETFLRVPEELGEDRPDGDFHARRLSLGAGLEGPASLVERVVLVHRLREVVAEIGFTRFEALASPVDSEVDLGARIAPLAQETRWLPAVENRGEGVFLALDARRVSKWAGEAAVERRARELEGGIQGASKKPVPFERIQHIYMPYVMLHSLSHLLLTAIALECGYAATSIRERIYVRDGAYGLLLYTGTSDAEGTLGGLVQVGRRIARHLEASLELGRLCSNDPVCAQHRPDQVHEARPLHGAACHGCLLIAEPSCERRNELLDRSLVVPTVDRADAAFFFRD